jgi:hypothetical protein
MILNACGEKKIPKGIDMIFSTRVHGIENTCLESPLPADSELELDLQLKLDGRSSMVGAAQGIPYFGWYPMIQQHDGNVDTMLEVKDKVTGRVFPYRVSGTLDMDDLHLTLESDWYRSENGLMKDCHVLTRLDGEANADGSLKAIGGAYRSVVRERADCFGLNFVEEEQAELIELGERRVEIHDIFGALVIGRDGSKLHAHEGSEAEGAIMTVQGTITPTYLSYTFEERFLAGGNWCHFSLDVDAVARFFPDQPWTPAFTPDPVNGMPLSAPRILSTSAPSALPSFSPLTRL